MSGETYKEDSPVNENGVMCEAKFPEPTTKPTVMDGRTFNITYYYPVLERNEYLSGRNSSEEWTYINTNNTDPRYCNAERDCERGEDEPAGCHKHSYIVTGSKDMDGMYNHSNGVNSKLNFYQGGNRFLFKSDNSWILSRGSSEAEAEVRYESEDDNNDTVPMGGWQDAIDGERQNGIFVKKSLPYLRIFQVPSNLTRNDWEDEHGLICQMPEDQSDKWLFIPKGDKINRRCNGVCECGSCVDENILSLP